MGDLDLLPSKLLSLLIRPDFWLWLGILTAFLAAWRGWRKLGFWVLASLIMTVTLVGFYPIGSVWLTPLESRFATNPELGGAPSAIIVLGGGEDPATSAAWNSFNLGSGGERITHALDRARQFPETPVIFTGSGFNPTNDQLLEGSPARVEAMLIALGLDPERLHVSGEARTTAEHPLDVVPILAALNIAPSDGAPLLLITSAFHMPRAMGVFCATGLGPVVADPTDHRTTPGRSVQSSLRWDYADNLAMLQTAFREWAGLAAYAAAGHTPSLLPGDCAAGS